MSVVAQNLSANQSEKDGPPQNDSGSSGGNPKRCGIGQIFLKHAGRGSMHGVAFINTSKNPVVKCIWSTLLLFAICALSYHLYSLFRTFYQFKKETQVELSYSSLQFPAVTLCNVNPMRLSQKYLASEELIDLINTMDPPNIDTTLGSFNVLFGGLFGGFSAMDDANVAAAVAASADYDYDDYGGDDKTDGGGGSDADGADFGLFFRKRRKRQIDTRGVGSTRTLRRKRRSSSTNTRARQPTGSFFDEMNISMNDTRGWMAVLQDFYHQHYAGSWEAESTRSAFYELEQSFQQLYVWEPRSLRAVMGHQMSDMLLQCSFSGGTCLASNFTRMQTTKYGNCYTLQYDKFISRRSGPAYGLQLLLYLETDEYISGVADSKGMQLVIHDQGTVPFPEEEGMAVRSGTETLIGLKQVQISRLGKPYGTCTDAEIFERKYGTKYTKKACQRFCLEELLQSRCNCFNILEQEVNSVLTRPRQMRPCETQEEIICLLNTTFAFETDNTNCNCHRACKETTFEKTVSFRAWPNKAFADLLSRAACRHNNTLCKNLLKKSGMNQSDEFIKLSIFYENLNYEELTESADYQIDQFLSDIGGTIGLWIGLSILALFELVHLIFEVIIYIGFGQWRSKLQNIDK